MLLSQGAVSAAGESSGTQFPGQVNESWNLYQFFSLQEVVIHEDPAPEVPIFAWSIVVEVCARFIQAAERGVAVKETGEQVGAGSLMAYNDEIVESHRGGIL